MDNLERCRILCGISEDNTKKLGLLTVLLEKAREDIEAFCRDTFVEALTNDEGIITGYADVFPKQLKNVQEDLAIQRFRKLGAEGESSYTLADESVTFDDPLPVSVEKKLYPYRQLFPRSYTLDDPVGGYKEG
ncbi:phage head-tail connector protein [Agathobacter rectalis]|jgi:DNA packaging protein, QLRG family|uniref:phage head-tail connector protein n=1 Tax=Agathobacter rectalis TaxID=39491 RepID=UPI0031B5DE4C